MLSLEILAIKKLTQTPDKFSQKERAEQTTHNQAYNILSYLNRYNGWAMRISGKYCTWRVHNKKT